MDLASQRLTQERKNFRKDRPYGFSAKPVTRPDGSTDLFKWKCIVPGKEGTYCEGGRFPVEIVFSKDYPARAPQVNMPRGFFHVNVFDNGAVCLSILKSDLPEHLKHHAVEVWKPSITVKQILLSIQELLHTPNFGSIANHAAYRVKNERGMAGYEQRMREQTKQYEQEEEGDE